MNSNMLRVLLLHGLLLVVLVAVSSSPIVQLLLIGRGRCRFLLLVRVVRVCVVILLNAVRVRF